MPCFLSDELWNQWHLCDLLVLAEADEMDLVTKYGLDVDVDELSGEDDLDIDADADDVEDMIERYSARTYSQMGFRKSSK